MKKVLTVICIVTSVLAVNAQTADKKAISTGNVLHFSTQTVGENKINALQPNPEEALSFKETEFNFGKIPQGKPVTHIFEIINTGNSSFKLDNVVASCGCTTPQWNKEKVISPGETSTITVGYNAAAEGPFNKSITVTYNTNQTKVTVIKGEVWKTPAASAPSNSTLNDFKN